MNKTKLKCKSSYCIVCIGNVICKMQNIFEKWRGDSLGVYHRYQYQYQWKYHQFVGYYYQPCQNQPNYQHDNFPKARKVFPCCTSVAAAAAALHPNNLRHLKQSLQTQHSMKTHIKLNQMQNKQHKDKLLLFRVTNHCETVLISPFLIKLGKEKLLLINSGII